MKSQFDEIKKYKKRKRGPITVKNLVLISSIMLLSVSIGYSYWNTSLKIHGTITAIRQSSGDDIYDPEDPEEGTHTYTDTPGSPEVTVDNGEVVSYEFTDNNGVEISGGDNLDTGIVAFDGSAFTIHLRMSTLLSDNNNKFIVTALEENNGLYNGFSIYIYNNSYIRLGVYVDRPRSNSTGLLIPNNYTSLNSKPINAEREFDIYLTYDPKGYKNQYAQLTVNVTDISSNKYIRNSSSGNRVPTSLSNATITLGGNGINGTDDMQSMTVYEFSVEKL